jgi:hypothetical protein
MGRYFEVLHDRIKTPGGGLIIFKGMSDHSALELYPERYDHTWEGRYAKAFEGLVAS